MHTLLPFESASFSRSTVSLHAAWLNIVTGAFAYAFELETVRGVAACFQPSGAERRPLTEAQLVVFQRCLTGERQKVIAADTGGTCSRVSVHLADAVAKVGSTGRALPLPLVVLAQQQAGLVPDSILEAVMLSSSRGRFLAIEVRRPFPSGSLLTPAERIVSTLFVEGSNRDELALARRCSYRTIACHLNAVFCKLHVSNRFEMVLAFAKRGWLGSPGDGTPSVQTPEDQESTHD